MNTSNTNKLELAIILLDIKKDEISYFNVTDNKVEINTKDKSYLMYLKNNYDVDLWELDNTWIPKTITNVITYVNKLKELQCI